MLNFYGSPQKKQQKQYKLGSFIPTCSHLNIVLFALDYGLYCTPKYNVLCLHIHQKYVSEETESRFAQNFQ